MKQLKLFVLFVAVVGLSSFEPAPSFTINGKINATGGKIYLKKFRNKMFFTIDSSRIVNGQFHFKGSVPRTDLYGLTTDRNESFSPYYIFIENKPIDVTIDVANRRKARVSGSEANDLYVKLQSKHDNFSIDSLVRAEPKSVVVAYILYREFSNDLSVKEIEDNLAQFDPSLKDLYYIKELERIVAIKKRVEIGQPAVDFAGTTPDNQTIRLSQSFGHYLLLDFWASWCGPCRRENPNLVRVYNKFKANGFDIFSVSLDKDKTAWTEAIAKDGLTWKHVSDLKFWDSEAAGLYAIRSIPSNVLIDPLGKIIARNLRGEVLEQKLEEIFNRQTK